MLDHPEDAEPLHLAGAEIHEGLCLPTEVGQPESAAHLFPFLGGEASAGGCEPADP